MDLVLTLIADKGKLTDDRLALAHRELANANCDVIKSDWLSDATAVDLYFHLDSSIPIEGRLRSALEELPLDLMVQPANDPDRKRRLLIADMDSTIITAECLDELADFADLKPQIAEITERAMRGELDFEEALDSRIGLLAEAGLTEDSLQKCFDERIVLTNGAKVLVNTMKNNGAHCALVSGGFTFFTQRVAQAAGFHDHRANTLLFEDGKLQAVKRPILGKEAKRHELVRRCADQGLGYGAALAVGDGANDLAMIELAGLGVAFHAKPVVAAAARAQVNHTDLTSLLYYQGYKEQDFAKV